MAAFCATGSRMGVLTQSVSLIYFIRQRRHFDETTGKKMKQLNPR